jgi:hypothetical protein
MSKTVLKFNDDDQFDFILIGIACQHKDYRLCHELNSSFGLVLKREKDYEIFNGRRMESLSFSFYSYNNQDDDSYFIMTNKGKQGLLIPEQKQIDYFLMIRENVKRINQSELISRMKQINIVLGIFKMDPKNLKSRENLLF